MARIAFLTCHLSGTGHLVRTLTLARTARSRGHAVTVLNGGRPLDHLIPDPEPVQLPPVVIRGLEFGVLRRPDGAEADAAHMAGRRAAITRALAATPPDVLVTELYPFGRRVLAGEFEFAIGQARALDPAAAILCSVRDVPEPKPRRLAGVADRLRADFDGVLVHGDAGFLPLSSHWPLPADLAPRLHHVGYLGRDMPAVPRGDVVLVSCGGGVLGRHLAALAVEAARLSARPWHILIGGSDAAGAAAALARATPANATIGAARPDFPELLAAAACSVSLCGYNTAVELAQCATPSILVPSAEGGEREQTLRARAFARLPGFVTLDADTLTADALAVAADRLAAGPPRAPSPLKVDRGERAIAVLEEILQNKNS